MSVACLYTPLSSGKNMNIKSLSALLAIVSAVVAPALSLAADRIEFGKLQSVDVFTGAVTVSGHEYIVSRAYSARAQEFLAANGTRIDATVSLSDIGGTEFVTGIEFVANSIASLPTRLADDMVGATDLRKQVQSIGGTGIQSIGGTGIQSIGGTGIQSIGGTGIQSIGGTGIQSIGGTGIQSIGGTGIQSIGGTGIQ